MSDEMQMFLRNTKARIEDMVGRDVMIIPIQDWAYSPVDANDLDDYRKWVLVIEQNGKTWIWDSYTMEG